MESNSLDSLASGGIINFDADAFVKGTKPRYVGNPGAEIYLPGDTPLYFNPTYGIKPGANLHGEPSTDAFIERGEHKQNSLPSFSTIIAGGLVATIAFLTGSKIKSLFTTKDSKKCNTIKDFFNKSKERIESYINPTKKAEETVKVSSETTVATEKTKEVVEKNGKKLIETVKEFCTKNSKGLKKTGIGLVGLLGLYGLYQVVSGPKSQPPQGH